VKHSPRTARRYPDDRLWGPLDLDVRDRDTREEQLGIRIESWLKERLEEIAKREERSVAQLVRRVLKNYVEKYPDS
jgi:hypothetical protein